MARPPRARPEWRAGTGPKSITAAKPNDGGSGCERARPFPGSRRGRPERRRSRSDASCRSVRDWDQHLHRWSLAPAPCRKSGNCQALSAGFADASGRCRRRPKRTLAASGCAVREFFPAAPRTSSDSGLNKNDRRVRHVHGDAPMSRDRPSSRTPDRFHLTPTAAQSLTP